MLALPFTTLHVDAHPLQLAEHPPTNDNVQILVRTQRAATNTHSPHPDHLSEIRDTIARYHDVHTQEQKGVYLQQLLAFFKTQTLPTSGITEEQAFLGPLEIHMVGLNVALEQAKNYYHSHGSRMVNPDGH
jgi:hypothetical protein